MRIAMVAPFGLRPKGTTIARALPIARVLAAEGAAVRLVVPPWDDPVRAASSTVDQGVEIVHTRIGIGPMRLAVVMWDLLRAVNAFRPDVVHVFKPIGYSGAVATWLGQRGLDHPLVVVDTDDLEGPGGWSTRRRMGLSGWLRGVQEVRTLRGASRVTVASEWLASFVQDLGVAPERVRWLPNGHAVAAPSQVAGGEPSPVPGWRGVDGPPLPLGESRGGGVSWLSPQPKSTLLWYTRLTDAAPDRAAAFLAPLLRSDDGLRLAVLGDELLAGAREALASALTSQGIANQVDWIPYGELGPDEGLPSAVGGRPVAVYPLEDDPVNRARCPSKVPQLMALGVPLVAEAVGEVRAYLAGFERECLAAPGDAEDFRAKLKHLLTNEVAAADLGARLQHAAERWRWEHTAEGLLEWYKDGLGDPYR